MTTTCRRAITSSCLGTLLVLACPAVLHSQEPVDGLKAEQQEETTVPPGAIQVSSIRHVNSSLVLFDEHERQFVIKNGVYISHEGLQLVISDGRIQRMVGCGEAPWDFATHATRVVDRRLLVYAELGIPDGTYRNDSGAWFRIEDGELVEYLSEAP